MERRGEKSVRGQGNFRFQAHSLLFFFSLVFYRVRSTSTSWAKSRASRGNAGQTHVQLGGGNTRGRNEGRRSWLVSPCPAAEQVLFGILCCLPLSGFCVLFCFLSFPLTCLAAGRYPLSLTYWLSSFHFTFPFDCL